MINPAITNAKAEYGLETDFSAIKRGTEKTVAKLPNSTMLLLMPIRSAKSPKTG